jgi:hypothetical protein
MSESAGARSEIDREHARLLEEERLLRKRAISMAATLKVVVEALEGQASFEALDNARFRVQTGALVEAAYPSFTDLKALLADLAFVERELRGLEARKRALEEEKRLPDQPRWPPAT